MRPHRPDGAVRMVRMRMVRDVNHGARGTTADAAQATCALFKGRDALASRLADVDSGSCLHRRRRRLSLAKEKTKDRSGFLLARIYCWVRSRLRPDSAPIRPTRPTRDSLPSPCVFFHRAGPQEPSVWAPCAIRSIRSMLARPSRASLRPVARNKKYDSGRRTLVLLQSESGFPRASSFCTPAWIPAGGGPLSCAPVV